MGNIAQPRTTPHLDGYADQDLHANIPEAMKRVIDAEEAFAQAAKSINSQYLKSMDQLGDAMRTQANAVRARLGLPQTAFDTAPTAAPAEDAPADDAA